MTEETKAIENALVRAAEEICLAAKTAPKACGKDSIVTAILTGEEIEKLAACMDELEKPRNKPIPIFSRDAQLLRSCGAVVLIGQKRVVRALNCGLCGRASCGECIADGGHCAFDDIDLGIALGSAASIAADKRIDNRILYTAGTAAMKLRLLGDGVATIMALPLAASERNRFFLRE